MRVVLDVIQGPRKGRSYVFDRHDTFIVGRSRFVHCAMPEDAALSRDHFLIEIQPPRWREPLHCVCVHLGLLARGRGRQLERLRQRIERLVPPDAPGKKSLPRTNVTPASIARARRSPASMPPSKSTQRK